VHGGGAGGGKEVMASTRGQMGTGADGHEAGGLETRGHEAGGLETRGHGPGGRFGDQSRKTVTR
jgi:hypothetical protein